MFAIVWSLIGRLLVTSWSDSDNRDSESQMT